MRTASFVILLLLSLAYCLADVSAGGVSSNALFDQFSSPASAGVLSQQMTDVSNLRFLAADDFVVPSDQTWKIQRVSIRGIFQAQKDAAAENGAIWNVRIYASTTGKTSGTAPAGAPIFEAPLLTADVNEAAGSSDFGLITLSLPNPAVLSPGTYWISVFPTKSGRAFFWQVSTTANLEQFLVNQDRGVNVCQNITNASEDGKWVVPPTSCTDAFFFQNGQQLDISTLQSLVFRLEGTTSSTGGTTGTVIGTTTGSNVIVGTTGNNGDGNVQITTSDTGVQGSVTTGNTNVAIEVTGSPASTLKAFISRVRIKERQGISKDG